MEASPLDATWLQLGCFLDTSSHALRDKNIERKLEEEEKEDEEEKKYEEREESSRKERDREKAKMGESSLAYYPCAAVLGSPQVAVALLHN